MPLVTSKEVLIPARERGYAVGAFNAFNLESVQAIIRAAEAERSPALIQIWSGLDAFIGIDVLAAIVKCEAQKATVPIVLHLDHGMSVEHSVKAVQYGFTSAMIDGSSLPLEENIAITKEVIRICHVAGIPVEGEIGHVGGEEGGDNNKDDMIETDVEEAVQFYQATGVDTLAVSIGTSHGKYTQTPQLNLDLLRRISEQISIPLVLHGSSYTPEYMIQEAISYGIAKINVATELNDIVIERITTDIQAGLKANFVSDINDGGYSAMEEVVRHKMRLFGSSGQANDQFQIRNEKRRLSL